MRLFLKPVPTIPPKQETTQSPTTTSTLQITLSDEIKTYPPTVMKPTQLSSLVTSRHFHDDDDYDDDYSYVELKENDDFYGQASINANKTTNSSLTNHNYVTDEDDAADDDYRNNENQDNYYWYSNKDNTENSTEPVSGPIFNSSSNEDKSFNSYNPEEISAKQTSIFASNTWYASLFLAYVVLPLIAIGIYYHKKVRSNSSKSLHSRATVYSSIYREGNKNIQIDSFSISEPKTIKDFQHHQCLSEETDDFVV